MHSVLLNGTFILFGIAGVLLLAWLVPFTLLMYRIQRKHPIYYKKIGRPYTWLTSNDISLKYGDITRERNLAWRRYLRQVYGETPDLVARDAACRHLVRFYRQAVRVFVVFTAAVILVVLPLDVLILTLGGHTTAAKTGGATVVRTPNEPSQATNESVSTDQPAKSTAIAPPQTTTQSSTKTTQTTTTTISNGGGPDVAVGTPTAPVAASPQPAQPSHLTRADITTVLATIAPPGQSRVHKRAACEAVIAQEGAASDAGPADSVCTDTNLLTYSTY